MSHSQNQTAKVQLQSLLDAEKIAEYIEKIADEVVARHNLKPDLYIVGVQTRGVEVARRIQLAISRRTGFNPLLGSVDVSMHRDDLKQRPSLPAIHPTKLPLDIEGRFILLVDDVLFTGRSARAAIEALYSFGRPGRIEFAVLVDRGHRELPIQADYVGIKIPTEYADRIRVRFQNIDGVPDSVQLVRPILT
ncbi:MAG: bifunctional pyr operon transcriptional regulator/uracil phosphoribosyltransferase PyrR [Chthoniobacterales bacterium]|nr:bifunctional pyr operon transcriptional regulator/uracil phosphoribosyltransferase PyrR [Chthoniobacterales bacterium]